MQCVVCGPSFCLICMNNTQCHILCSVQYMYSNRIAYLHIIMHCSIACLNVYMILLKGSQNVCLLGSYHQHSVELAEQSSAIPKGLHFRLQLHHRCSNYAIIKLKRVKHLVFQQDALAMYEACLATRCINVQHYPNNVACLQVIMVPKATIIWHVIHTEYWLCTINAKRS